MRYAAQVHVSDIMDLVAVEVRISAWDGLSTAPEEISHFTVSTAGYGISDPLEWLQRALRLALPQ
jgi:hypothetical protein